jgi:hypothetical protein
MFSTEAMNDNPNYRIFVQAFVGTDLAIPGAIYLTPTVAMASTPLHNHALDFASTLTISTNHQLMLELIPLKSSGL